MFKLKKERINQEKIDKGVSGYVYPYQKDQKDPKDIEWVVKRVHANDVDELMNSFPEIVLGFSCDHPCILPLKGYSIQKGSEGDYYVYLKLPRMKESLKNRFEDQKGTKSPFPEQKIVQYFYSLVCAVNYLHSKKIYHRDIKPANILLDKDGNAKLSDIGVAKYVGEEENYQQLTGNGGTVDYTAPEFYQGKVKLTKESLRANDVWGIGLVMLELCTLERRLFNPLTPKKKIKEIQDNLKKKLKEIYAEKLVDLIFELLKVNPNKRMKIEDVKKILGEQYSYCRDLEIGSDRYECEVLKEKNKRLNEKFLKATTKMRAIIEVLKRDNLKLRNDLREYRSSVKKLHSQMVSDINNCYNQAIEKLKAKDQALNQHNTNKVEEHKINVALFGCEGSGRHSFIVRFTENCFSEKKFSHKFNKLETSKRRIAIDEKLLFILSFFENLSEQMNHQEEMLETYWLRSYEVYLAFYDITDRQSFQNLKLQSDRFSHSFHNQIVFVVGTKLDLESQRQVTKREAEAFAKENGAVYFEISSKTGENLLELQEELTKTLLKRYRPSAPSKTVKAAEKTIEKKKSSFWGLFG